jgi:signal transduction histidine kinase
MEVMIYGIFYATIYVVLCAMFVETFEEKRTFAKNLYRYGIFALLAAAVYIVTVIFENNIALKEIFVIMLCAFCMWICFEQKFTKAVILVLIYQGTGLLIDYLTIIVISKCFPVITMENLSEPMVNLMLGTLSQIFLFCFIMSVRKCVVRKSAEVLTATEWVRFAVFPVFTIIVVVALLTGFQIPLNSTQKNILICIAFGLLLMNIIVLTLINDVLKREMLIREDKLFRERVINETGMYRTISENYDKQRKLQHEYKNQMMVIAALASENKVEELNHYLEEHNKKNLVNLDLIDTNNVIVNAILNSKYQEASEKGIVFAVKVNDLSDIKIKDEDIVLILSNLLNNAIEASEKCDEAVIKLKFVKENNQIIISVANTMSTTPSVNGNIFVTSKTEDADMHGIGIENIKEAVEKYGGSYVIKHDRGSFRFAILIPD